MDHFIDPSARIVKSQLDEPVSVYRNASIKGSHVGSTCWIGEEAVLTDSQLAEHVSVNRRNFVLRSSIGSYSYTGTDTQIRSARIGRYCSFSWNVSIGGGNHEMDRLTSLTEERFHFLDDRLDKKAMSEVSKARVAQLPTCVIGNDVWVAAGAIINNGVTIGNGAVIGAGAVVNRDVEPYSVVVGVPAKVVKRRFSDEVISDLQDLKWWEWPADKIRTNASLVFATKIDRDVIARLREIAMNRNDAL